MVNRWRTFGQLTSNGATTSLIPTRYIICIFSLRELIVGFTLLNTAMVLQMVTVSELVAS